MDIALGSRDGNPAFEPGFRPLRNANFNVAIKRHDEPEKAINSVATGAAAQKLGKIGLWQSDKLSGLGLGKFTTIAQSEQLSSLLTDAGLEHEVLNARNHALEAEIVAEAGHPGRITVATNMAGRGTDISLRGNSDELGGLHVICSEPHAAARLDRPLAGRCSRQGDPGSFRQFMSLEDAVALSGDMGAFIVRVENEGLNGIVGGLENYDAVEGADLMERILEVSRADLDSLFSTG